MAEADAAPAIATEAAKPAALTRRITGSLARRMIAIATIWISVLLIGGGFALDRVLTGAITREGATLVPLDIHFNDRGRAKILLGVAEGKKQHDKRAAIAERDWQRDKSRMMRNKGQE